MVAHGLHAKLPDAYIKYHVMCLIAIVSICYVGKSQGYVKMHVQEHISEVMKVYNKCILLPNHTATRSTPPSAPVQGSFIRSLTTTSLATQSLSKNKTSYKDPKLSQLAQGLCVPINATPTSQR